MSVSACICAAHSACDTMCRVMECEREDGELEEGELDDDDDDENDGDADGGVAGGDTGQLSDDDNDDDGHGQPSRSIIQLQPFNGLFSRTTWVSRYQKGKTNLDFTGARDSE